MQWDYYLLVIFENQLFSLIIFSKSTYLRPICRNDFKDLLIRFINTAITNSGNGFKVTLLTLKLMTSLYQLPIIDISRKMIPNPIIPVRL